MLLLITAVGPSQASAAWQVRSVLLTTYWQGDVCFVKARLANQSPASLLLYWVGSLAGYCYITVGGYRYLAATDSIY